MTEHGLFAVDKEARTIRGLLLPFNELSSPSQSKTEPILFSAQTVELPTDPAAATLTQLHAVPTITLGHATELTETDKGIEAVFEIVRTPEGDALLAAAATGDKPKLSAELTGLVRSGVRATKAALTGAAVVPQGAFASAALFSAVELTEKEEAEVVEEVTEDVQPEAPAVTPELVAEITAQVIKAIEDETESKEEEDKDKGDDMSNAVAPEGLQTKDDKKDKTSANGLFQALAQSRNTGNSEALTSYESNAMFAIANINHNTGSSATIGTDVAAPAYIGELWKARAYERKYLPLFNQATLTSYKVNGWRFVDGKTPEVAAYAGNGADVPSGAVDTEPVSVDAERIAGGHKIDRRFTDFSDQGFWEAYFRSMTESYARVSDKNVLDAAVAAATATAAGTAPAGVAKGLAGIVDGALSVIAEENTPTFAVVSAELWRDIVLTGHNDVLGYLSASFGLEEGSTDGFKIIPGAVGTGKVLVGSKEAMTVHELGGSPIRVEGLSPHSGTVDPALYGYLAKVTHNAKALALVSTTAP